MGEFWFGEGAEVVVEGDFVGFLGAETVSSHVPAVHLVDFFWDDAMN